MGTEKCQHFYMFSKNELENSVQYNLQFFVVLYVWKCIAILFYLDFQIPIFQLLFIKCNGCS